MAKTLSFTDASAQIVKIGDTTTSFTLVCGNDNVATSLTNATSITVKLGNASGYLKSATVDPASLTDPTTGQVTVKFTADLMTSLPAGHYFIEVWVVDSTGTSIYPSDGPIGFTITDNIQSTNGETITTITFDDFVNKFNDIATKYRSGEIKDGSITAAKLAPNVLPLTFASPAPINFNFQKGKCEVPNGSAFLQNNQAFEVSQHSFDIDSNTIGWIAFSKIDNQFKIDNVPTNDEVIVGYIWNGKAFLKCANYNINGHDSAFISLSKGVMGFAFSQNDLVVNNATKQLKFNGQLTIKLHDGQEYVLKPVSQGGTQPDIIDLNNNGNDSDWLSFDADAQKIIFGTAGDNIYRIGYSLGGGTDIYINGISNIIVDDGFNMAVLGDSMTEGVNTSKAYHQFWNDFLHEDKIGVNIVNHGVGGTTVGDVGFNDDLASKSFVKRYPSIDNNTQMTIIFGGANDYNYGTELGEVDSTDPKTFCGALNTIIKGLLSKNPTMHIVGMTPMKTNYQDKNWDITKNNQGLLIIDYVNAMINVLNAHGLNCIDLYHNSGIDMTNPSIKQAISVDGLHPNATGHDMIARYSYPFIKEYINHYAGPVADNKYHN